MATLKKSSSNKVLCGVCGGLASHMNIDVTVLRILWVCAVLFAGFGILLYLVCALLMPNE